MNQAAAKCYVTTYVLLRQQCKESLPSVHPHWKRLPVGIHQLHSKLHYSMPPLTDPDGNHVGKSVSAASYSQEVAPQPYYGIGAASGVSSFGMSGVNAHGMFAASKSQEGYPDGHPRPEVPWQRTVHWPVPKPHHFLGTATAERRSGLCT